MQNFSRAWQPFVQGRGLSLAAVLITLLSLLAILLRMPADSQFFQHDYGIEPSAVYVFYLLLIGLLVIISVFEPRIRQEVADGKATALIVFLAGSVSFLALLILIPNQHHRLVRQNLSLSFILLNLVILSALTVLLVSLRPTAPASRRIYRLALVVVIGFGMVTAVLHILNTESYMRIILPDEPWFASIAENYAREGTIRTPNLGDPFGVPDPVAPRYFTLMGLWARLMGDASLATLRGFNVLVGLVVVALVGWTLWRLPFLNTLQKLIGPVSLLGMTAFMRTSHNLRMDIGLAVYGALVLMGYTFYYLREHQQRRWLFLMGLALYIGLETVPTAALLFGMAFGLVIVAQAIRWPLRQTDWQAVAIYAAGSLIAGLIYAGVHFLPDFPAQLGMYRRHLTFYSSEALQLARLSRLFNYFTAFTLALSPAELLIAGLGLGLLFLRGRDAEKWLAAAVLLGFLGIYLVIGKSYGYLTFFAPITAYALARACRTEARVMVGAFVLLPALLSPVIHDYTSEYRVNWNRATLDEYDLLTWQIPENTTVMADPIFWFTLHDNRDVLSWNALNLNQRMEPGVSRADVIERLDVDIMICEEGTVFCTIAEDNGFEQSSEFRITSGNYLIYQQP